MGYWSFLNGVASRDAINAINDGVPWRSHASNGNAALLASLDLDTWDKHFTIGEGMDALPEAMVRAFDNSSETHGVHYNRRLACVQKENRYFTLIFQKTVTDKYGVTTNLTESERVCTRKLVLAISPSALKFIKFTGFEEDATSPADLIESRLDPIPVMTAYFLFNKSWWGWEGPRYKDVITDLPVRRVRYVGSTSVTSKDSGQPQERHLFMVASPDMQDVEYFDPLLQASRYNVLIRTDKNLTMQALIDLKLQIAKTQGVPVSSIPDPVEVIIKDWRQDPSHAGWHMWKRGVHWDKMSKCLRKPYFRENVYLIGSDICPGSCQFWAEGGLQTVETLLNETFPKAYISPFEDEQWTDDSHDDTTVSIIYS